MYQGSKNIEVGKVGHMNVTIGCISPEARDLLDTIMLEWGKHNKERLKLFPRKRSSIYGFAYWLIRWSGLIQPASNNPLHLTPSRERQNRRPSGRK